MITVIGTGDHTYRVDDAEGNTVGWIRGRNVTLQGFADERAAFTAARRAGEALHSIIARRGRGPRPPRPNMSGLRLVHDGAYEWISDGRIPLARLHRPAAGGAGDGTHTIEFVLPYDVNEALAVEAAQLMGEAALGQLLRGAGSGDPDGMRGDRRGGAIDPSPAA